MADLDPAPLRTCGEPFRRIISQRRALIQAQGRENFRGDTAGGTRLLIVDYCRAPPFSGAH